MIRESMTTDNPSLLTLTEQCQEERVSLIGPSITIAVMIRWTSVKRTACFQHNTTAPRKAHPSTPPNSMPVTERWTRNRKTPSQLPLLQTYPFFLPSFECSPRTYPFSWLSSNGGPLVKSFPICGRSFTGVVWNVLCKSLIC